MDIDVSKENIQPLRGGRNALQLGAALQAQSDVDAQKLLQQQKDEHEAAIRQYQGPDPLDPWFNYIQWVEQSYPKHGHEGHMDKLIKDCLQLFEREEAYFQDRRLVKLWIKYIDSLSNPMEIYQRLYNMGLGVECSEFYRAWACYCEESGDFKKANQVYMLGLHAKAQPLDELEQAHMNFQLFYAQRMLHDDSPTKRKAASALAETRLALTSLKSFKRRNIAAAPIQRVGDNIKSIVPGTLRQQGPDGRHQTQNVMVNVYEDAPSTSREVVPVSEDPGLASLLQANNVENEKEVGMWTNPKTKMVHSNIVPHQPLPFTRITYSTSFNFNGHPYSSTKKMGVGLIPSCLLNSNSCQTMEPKDSTKLYSSEFFAAYEDSNDELRLPANYLPYCVDDLVFNVPLCVPDPPDPTKIPCYNKVEVYVGDKEYSLEEIRSRKFDLEKKIRPVQEAEERQNENSNENFMQCSALETLANCALDSEHDHMSQLMPLQIPSLQNVKVNSIHSPGEPKVLVNLDSKELSNHESKKEEKYDKDNQMDEAGYNGTNYPKNNLMEEFNRSLMGNLLGDSVTVNTKEARWELRNIFNDNNVLEPSMVQPVVQQFEVPKFDIHEDRSITMALNTKKNYDTNDSPDLPNDKENDKKFAPPTPSVPQANKTAYYEEPSCTQVFNFNVNDASTPNMSQFKKPISCIDSSKFSMTKFNIDESAMDQDHKREDLKPDQHLTVDNQGVGLSVIMEATREYNSKSGSSSSGQSTRGNFTGYTTNYDSMYNNDHMQQNSKRVSLASQARLPNGQFRSAPQKPQEKQTAVPYHTQDQQYQKPVQNQYNGYNSQTSMQYPQNYSYQHQQAYNSQVINQPQMQGYGSPVYHSPQHPGMQSPHDVNAAQSVPPGFQSPTYSNQGYRSPGHAMMSPQNPYPGRQEFYPNQPERQSYATQQAIYQSPTQQPQYQNPQYYQRPSQLPQSQAYSQNYMHAQYSTANMYSNTNQTNSPNYSTVQSPYRQPPKHTENQSFSMPQSNQSFQIYQSPQQSQHNYRNTSAHNHSQGSHDVQMRHENLANADESGKNKSQPPNKCQTTSRNVKQDQPSAKIEQKSPDAGFSNQFLHFITNRNEPKDNANTPKFTNSPSISQKMHKNLYVSSPEQAQIPPSSGLSDSDSKDGMTVQSATPIQSAKISHMVDKSKDVSKRQLDFEHRVDIHSEDSRDSVNKDGRYVGSRQSDYGMDVDSENSMDCIPYKSNHSISMVSTSDISRPADIEFPKVIDPFNKKILSSLLEYVKFPNKTHAEGYNEVRSIPKLQLATLVTVGGSKFSIEKQLGKGNYGAVFLCLDINSNKSVAVKYQKPSRPWEFYICQEIKARIKNPFMLPGYMDISTAFLGDNASLFVSEYSKYGSLLDVANKVRVATSKCINELIVILFTAEMLSIVHYLHKAQIIHADIKPDNFLLMKIPTQEWRTPSLQLIDFGCAIDMSLFPEDTTFREVIATEGFTCTEMREGKPWTYQTDLYCLAGTIHVILMGSYMKVANRLGQWNIDKKLPRYMKVSLWDKIFTTLLNVPDCNNLPDLMDLKENILNEIDNVSYHLRTFANVLKSR